MANKYAAYGAKLQYQVSGVWTDIAGVRDISGPGMSADTVDVTTHDSEDGWREHLKTLKDGGEISYDLVWDPEDVSTQKKLIDELDSTSSTPTNYRLVFATLNSKAWQVAAFVTGFEPNDPVEGEISAAVTMKVTGRPTFTLV